MKKVIKSDFSMFKTYAFNNKVRNEIQIRFWGAAINRSLAWRRGW